MVIADLAQKKFISSPTSPLKKIDDYGIVLGIADNKVMKLIPSKKGRPLYFMDLNNGTVQEPLSFLGEEIEPPNKIVYPNPKFEKVLLLQSKVGISAYVTK